MTVPAAGSVLTPVTRLPTPGKLAAIVSLMPADFQLSVAFNDPMVPLEFAESCNRTSVRITSAVIPLAL